MTLWDDLPGSATSGGALDSLRPLLDSVDSPSSTERPEEDGTWRIWSTTIGGDRSLEMDLSSGAISHGGSTGDGGAIELSSGFGIELGLRLTAGGTDPDGTMRLTLTVPSSSIRVPFLRGAVLDAQGQLRADPSHPAVRFRLPSVKVRVLRPAGGSVGVDLIPVPSGGTPDEPVLDLVRMEPAYALIGPDDVVGFAFRAAVLDLSGTAGPAGVPDGARTMPDEWQGLYLPEVRLFVAPHGVEGLAVSAGVRNLWIGFGVHAGVTGDFNAEVVNRGSAPSVRVRFQTPAGEWIGVQDTDPVPAVELPESVTMFVDGGGGVAPLRIRLLVDGSETVSDRVALTVPDTGSLHVEVTVSDAGSHSTTRSFDVRRRSGAGHASSSARDVVPTTTSDVGYRVVTQPATGSTVTVSLNEDPQGTVVWTWAGHAPVTAPTAQIEVTTGAPVDVQARITRTGGGGTTTVDAYFSFDHPTPAEIASGPSTPWWMTPGNMRSQPWRTRTDPGAAPDLLSPDGLARLNALPKGAHWTVEGWASYEGSSGTAAHNLGLSERRRDALVALLADASRPELHFTDVTPVTPGHGETVAQASGPHGNPPQDAPDWWHARASAAVDQTIDVTAHLERPAADPPPQQVDPRPTPTPVPACFRKIGVTVELVRSTFVRAEIYGEIDIQTAAENQIASASPGATIPPRDNPSDGISQFLLRLRIAEDRSGWDVTAQFRAIEDDKDGLWQRRRGTGDQTGLDILGAVAVLSPLLAAVTPASPTAGELVPMVLVGGAAVAVGAAGVITTQKITLHGGQLMVTDGLVDPATGVGPRSTSISILLDVETAFTFDIGILRVEPTKPLTARYKAVGVRSQWRSDPQPDGTVQYVPLPVFDPSAGYSLDIPMGSLVGPDALRDILRVVGGRISRDNPLYLEVEVGLGVDLGIVTVDSARVRVRLDQAEFPQLTALGASIDVPDVLHGSGYVKIDETGFEGAFDVTLTPVKLRIAAQIAVKQDQGVTGVLIGAEVEFPVPIPLANSGLAIYGFLGGVAVNFARREESSSQVPALDWLQTQLSEPNPSVMKPSGWKVQPGAFAVAGGILLGTAEGGFIVNLKGLVLVEVPGPRLLFAMKADVIKIPPALKDPSQQATFLAVLDLDLGRGTITIGLVASYEVKSLLTIRVPVTAFFDAHHLDQWFVDLGSNTNPVTVSVLDVFEGTGYLMVHGDGTTIHIEGLPLVTTGITVAVGFHINVVLMGSKAVGLYLEVAAGFDAIVAFSPFAIGGRIYVSGELRLWIIGISASAELTVLVGRQVVDAGLPSEHTEDRTYVHGQVCGEVDFFFFSVKGCVELTIGDDTPLPLIPPPLVSGVSLVSRSPALVDGSAVDRAVDGVLGRAVEVGAPDELPSVPLDAIPVVLFETAPGVKAGNVVLGGVARGANGLPANPWIRRGESWFRYRITGVELVGELTAGATPATWWARALVGDPQVGPALALLSWLPTATPRAVALGRELTTTVEERWGTICTPVAKAVPVLWTFDEQATGPSARGWVLQGVAWPDEPGTWRSAPADSEAVVREPWRTGDAFVDLLQGTDPAVVVGDRVTCPRKDRGPVVGARQEALAVGTSSTFGPGALPAAGAGTDDVMTLLAGGVSLQDANAAWGRIATGDGQSTCEGRILRSPTGDEPEPAPGADDREVEQVKTAWDTLGFAPSELADAVTLRVEGGLGSFDALLLVPRRGVERGLVARFRDADGTLLDEYRASGADMVGPSHPIPPQWLAGPWSDPVQRAAQIAGRVIAAGGGLLPVLLSPKVPDGTVVVELGWDRDAKDLVGLAFWVVAAAGTTAAELHREDWDTTTITSDKDAVTTAVTDDPDDHALLLPGREYTVRVSWEAQSLTQEARPAANAPEAYTAGTPQEFRFRADGADRAPERLDPWLLTTAPGVGETGVLLDEPLRIALATQKVGALFDAYGEELRVVVRSASGRHPSPPGGGAPGSSLTIPVELDAHLLVEAEGTAVMTPWQETVTALLDALPCTPGTGSRTYHSVITLDYPLEPLTDYLLDVLAVTKGAPEGAAGRRLYRVPFTTSRFHDVPELAGLLSATRVAHALVPVPSALAALGERPTGNQLDDAFQAAGLPVPEVPRYPAVQVLWSPDTVPQPVAVVVEGSEALWRSRLVATRVEGPADAEDPSHEWWAPRPGPWLTLEVPGGGAPVTRVVRGPGDTRAVILLGAGARGTQLTVQLVRAADELAGTPAKPATAVQVLLERAPWEVED
ncbi:DUF6603 domain-containing protein [Cellulomonas edaphi]|uniref:DUF6603 domain-containing protein n=1 Tax=Cellulomonas edaphi TaxID=3053468 RepID=A0ABT7S3R4_9CELL|nr:DUF6603 domain-containing protein [Cellulomons edaphi]MDM7830260.1 hypothetical protein [Cellulomons edaphi]